MAQVQPPPAQYQVNAPPPIYKPDQASHYETIQLGSQPSSDVENQQDKATTKVDKDATPPPPSTGKAICGLFGIGMIIFLVWVIHRYWNEHDGNTPAGPSSTTYHIPGT